MIVILSEAKDLNRAIGAIPVIWLFRAHRCKRFSRVTQHGSRNIEDQED
jgi:hypothetical protein